MADGIDGPSGGDRAALPAVVLVHATSFGSSGPLAAPAKFPTTTIGIHALPRGALDSLPLGHVLVRVDAFSCNYRDRLSMVAASSSTPGTATSFAYFGSDFAGKIAACGADVGNFHVGEVVIGNNAYEDASPELRGVPTNEASRRWLILPASKVMALPDSISLSVAASLSLCGQTAVSMIRRANLVSDESVLLCAGTSSLSLFLLSLLNSRGIHPTVITSRAHLTDELLSRGAGEVLQYSKGSISSPQGSFPRNSYRRFSVVFDPFADIYLPIVSQLVGMSARYVTCGLSEQSAAADYAGAIHSVIGRNINLIGNCLGTSEDLRQAVSAVLRGELKVPVDRSFSFVRHRQYVSHFFSEHRLGKVVLDYSDI